MSKEDHEPSWLDAENDESHKAEVEPLFGTGKLSLQDEHDEEKNILNPRATDKSNPSYGAISNQHEDEHAEQTVISSASNQSGKSKQSIVSKIVITETGKPEVPRKNCLVAGFNLIETVGVVTSIALLGSQIMPLIIIPLNQIGLASIGLKIYVSLFCVIFLLVESDAPIGFLRGATFLQTYISRGFLYSFIGLSALEEAYSERVDDMIAHVRDQFHVSWFSLFMQVSAWMMMALGFVYMIFGLCCLKALRDKVNRDHQKKWAVYREALKVYDRENP